MKRKALALATAAAALVLLLAACGGGDATSTPRPTDRPPTEPTDTPQPTATLAPGETPQPTATPAPTPTRRPTATPFPTPTPAPTAVGPPFYEGKTIRIIVNATPGGGYDAYARLVARHIGKHIPGNPDVIVQNMPGGNTLRGPNFIAVAAPRDGTVFGTIVNSNYMEQFLGEPGVEFDVTTLSWVGSPAFTTDTVYCRTDVVGDRTLEELAAAQQSGEVRKLFLGSSNPTAFVSHARILQEFVPGFDWELVLGYPGGAEFRLAVRKGEIDCAGGSKDSFLADMSDLLEAGELNILSTTGDANLDRDPTFPDVPTLLERAKTPADIALASAYVASPATGRPFAAPPGVPLDRLAILREGFRQAVLDPEFVADAEQIRRPISYVPPEAIVKVFQDLFSAPEEEKARIAKILSGEE